MRRASCLPCPLMESAKRSEAGTLVDVAEADGFRTARTRAGQPGRWKASSPLKRMPRLRPPRPRGLRPPAGSCSMERRKSPRALVPRGNQWNARPRPRRSPASRSWTSAQPGRGCKDKMEDGGYMIDSCRERGPGSGEGNKLREKRPACCFSRSGLFAGTRPKATRAAT